MGVSDRQQFFYDVMVRAEHTCVVPTCGEPAVDAHHIIERRLWQGDGFGGSRDNGGYFWPNGAALCGPHHFEAEQTIISCEQLREWAGITEVVLPEHLSEDEVWDKWGNLVLPNGMRLRGELFYDPRTFHLPGSPGRGKDDRALGNTSMFEGKEVVVTVKMDGENTTMYRDGLHARSLDFTSHPSRDRVRALQGRMGFEIPQDWRICGENLYAKHSIHYTRLPDWFLTFSVWDEKNICLSWDETLEWAELLGLRVVPELYRGIWDEELIKSLYTPEVSGDVCEGYVVRLASSFTYREFRQSVAKYVRAHHVALQDGHWTSREVVPNGREWAELLTAEYMEELEGDCSNPMAGSPRHFRKK
jgi:hypothetical protein